MPVIILYLLKLSVSLTVVFLFYHFILQKLTFYNSNRWYLLGYTLLSFFIPFIDISPVLEENSWTNNSVLTWIPVIQSDVATTQTVVKASLLSVWDAVVLSVLAGMIIILLRLVIQLFSFRRIMRKATIISSEGMNLYQVDEQIIPFSFGNSIFINRNLHKADELQEIIRHEFVHVKQRHSLDILWGEFLCLVNWYNPFAWLLKRSIRQNLEFIADKKVLDNGFSKKEYQYLLLKVIGNSQFSIATQFNFSSLKKRIAMMNKTKSAKRQLLRLLFLLPATAILLLAFRNKWQSDEPNNADKRVSIAGLVVDATTMKPVAGATIICKEKNITTYTDERGYYKIQLPFENRELEFSLSISKYGYSPLIQNEHWGNFYEEAIYKMYGKTIEFFGLTKSSEANRNFSSIAGNSANEEGLEYNGVIMRLPSLQDELNTPVVSVDTIPFVTTPNDKGYFIDILDNNGDCMVSIKDKNGKEVERMLLTKWKSDSKKYEKQYGEILMPPAPPTPPVPTDPNAPAIAPVPPAVPCPVNNVTPPAAPNAVGAYGSNLSPVSSEFEITNKKATIKLKNGVTENYDLTNKDERAAFEKKYGKIINVNTNIDAHTAIGINSNVNAVITVPPAIATGVNANVNSNTNTYITTTDIAEGYTVTSDRGNVARSVRSTTPRAAVAGRGGVTAVGSSVAAPRAGVAVFDGDVVVDDFGSTITGKEAIVITITKKTTREELNTYIKQMKEKGVELQFDEIEYNSKGILVNLTGTMKSGGSKSNFVAVDFNTLTLAMIKGGDKTYLKISTTDNNEVI